MAYNFDKSFSRSSPSDVFLGKGVQKTCSKFPREHPFSKTHVLRKLLGDLVRTRSVYNGFSGLLKHVSNFAGYTE